MFYCRALNKFLVAHELPLFTPHWPLLHTIAGFGQKQLVNNRVSAFWVLFLFSDTIDHLDLTHLGATHRFSTSINGIVIWSRLQILHVFITFSVQYTRILVKMFYSIAIILLQMKFIDRSHWSCLNCSTIDRQLIIAPSITPGSMLIIIKFTTCWLVKMMVFGSVLLVAAEATHNWCLPVRLLRCTRCFGTGPSVLFSLRFKHSSLSLFIIY